MDHEKLHAQRIGINEIDWALQNWTVNLPTGQLFGRSATFNIKAGGQLRNAEAFRPVVVAYRNGAPVRLDQVANVVDSVENVYNQGWFYRKEDGKPTTTRAIRLMAMRKPGA